MAFLTDNQMEFLDGPDIMVPTPQGRQHPLSTHSPFEQRVLNREAVSDFLDMAQQKAMIRDKYDPSLARALRDYLCEGIHDSNDRNRHEADILMNYLDGERKIFDGFNRQVLAKNKLDQVIPNDLKSFPLRRTVVREINIRLPNGILQPIATQLSDLAPPIVQKPLKVKTGKAAVSYDKLDGAPVANTDFPRINITLAEMAAFLPHSIKCWDVIDRFVGNGGTQAAYAKMINHFRYMPRGPISANSVYRMMKGSVNKRAKLDPKYEGWTTGSHKYIQTSKVLDPTSISVAGFRTPQEGKLKYSASSVPIKELANNVNVFPSGLDALDLTRAVQYCVAHPEEKLMYPNDVERVIRFLGPALVRQGHQDAAVLKRHTTDSMATRAMHAYSRKRDPHGCLMKAEAESSDEEDHDAIGSSEDDYDSDMYRGVPAKKATNANATHASDDSDSDSDSTLDGFDTRSEHPAKRRRFESTSRSLPGSNLESGTHPSCLQHRATSHVNGSEVEDNVHQVRGMMTRSNTRRQQTRSSRYTKSYAVDGSDSDEV